MKNIEEIRFELYITVLRFLPFKITSNLKRIYFDFQIDSELVVLTAYYDNYPSELELELLDDIVTNSDAHMPHNFVSAEVRLLKDYNNNEKHDGVVFAMYENLNDFGID